MARIIWLGQAGYLLSAGNTSMVIDPYFSEAGQDLARLYPPTFGKGALQADFAVGAHGHGDRPDAETLGDYIGFGRFYGPKSCVAELEKAGFPAERLSLFERGDRVVHGDLAFTGVFADYTEDSIGYVVECGERRLYFSGDSLMNKRLHAITWHHPDIMFVRVNGKSGGMSCSEAADFARVLRVKTAVPTYHGMAISSGDLALFTAALEDSDIRALTLERGKEYELSDLL
ncbi:MBL fold metallo-hydrolase [Clostridia bacterium]|nr:MBL fold metallo-hydrolase [Clostridia bacterium]